LDLAQIGGVLRAERKKQGKSLEQIAEELGYGASTISSIERGIQNVSQEKRIAYAKAVRMGSLFGIVEEAEQRIRLLRRKLRIIEDIVVANPKQALKQLAHLNQVEKIEYMGVLRPFIHYLKGKSYLAQQDREKAEKHFRYGIESMVKFPELEDTNLKAACYNELSTIKHIQGNYQEALKQARLGLANFVDDGERTYYESLLLLNQCIYLDGLGLSEETLKTLDELNTYVETTVNRHKIRTSLVIKMYTLYTNTLDKLNMPQKALEYAKDGEEIAVTNQELDSLFVLWSQIGSIYLKMEKLELAEEYFFKALDLQPKVKRQHLIPFAFKDFATLLMIKNDWTFAKEIIDQCISISKTQQDERNLAESLISSAKWCMKQDLFQEAIDLYKAAEEIADKRPTKPQLLIITSNLCYCYKQVNDLDKFQTYLERFYWICREEADKGSFHEIDFSLS
jgi:tetratricopeptide (TPR) repeat protein